MLHNSQVGLKANHVTAELAPCVFFKPAYEDDLNYEVQPNN